MTLRLVVLAIVCASCGGAAPPAHTAPEHVAAPAHCPASIVATASIETLTACVLDETTAADVRHAVLEKLAAEAAAPDTRAFPAFVHALAWHGPEDEDDATLAAKAIAALTLDDERRGEAVDAVAGALEHVQGSSGADNRLRIATMRALGELGTPRAVETLSRSALRRDPAQSFLLDRVAFEQLARIAFHGGPIDASTISTLILGLYLFPAAEPQMRVNDVASTALVAVGRPALAPLLETLAGRNDAANALAAEYVTVVHDRAPDVHIGQGATVACEAAFALGALGFTDAVDPLIAEATQLDPGESARRPETDEMDRQRELCAALALVPLARAPSEAVRIRAALLGVYTRLSDDLPTRMQLMVAMAHTFDAGLVPFFVQHARFPRGTGPGADPDTPVIAFRSAMTLGSSSEVAALVRGIPHAPEDVREILGEHATPALLEAMQACGATVACWIERLTSDDVNVAAKAEVMLARYARGSVPAAVALAEVVRSSRGDQLVVGALEALDVVATAPSPEVAASLGALVADESAHQNLRDAAAAVAARIARRSQ